MSFQKLIFYTTKYFKIKLCKFLHTSYRRNDSLLREAQVIPQLPTKTGILGNKAIILQCEIMKSDRAKYEIL